MLKQRIYLSIIQPTVFWVGQSFEVNLSWKICITKVQNSHTRKINCLRCTTSNVSFLTRIIRWDFGRPIFLSIEAHLHMLTLTKNDKRIMLTSQVEIKKKTCQMSNSWMQSSQLLAIGSFYGWNQTHFAFCIKEMQTCKSNSVRFTYLSSKHTWSTQDTKQTAVTQRLVFFFSFLLCYLQLPFCPLVKHSLGMHDLI